MKFRRKGSAAGEMPFLDHLEELRWRILWSLLALVAGAAIGFFLVTHLDILGLLIAPIQPLLGAGRLKYLSPTDPFFITLKLALLIGGLLALPIIIYQIWAFVSPALLPREKRAIVPALYMGLVLFLAGVALAYFVALPTTLRFMMGFQVESLEQNIVVGAYMSFVVRLLLAFGLVFELPVVVLLLSVIGVVDARMLAAGRRYALVAITVVASVITPGDFIVLTLFLMIPLMLLYELSIGLAKLVERRRARALAAEKAAAEASRGVAWILAVLLAGGLLLAAGPAAAQEPRLPEDSLRVKMLDRLRTLKPARAAPPAAAADDAAPMSPVDTSARAPAPQPAAPSPAATAAADSILQALLRLDGFAATEYEGAAATYAADSARIDLTGKARVTRAGNTMTADSLLTYELGTAVACGYGAPVLTGQGTTSPVESEQVCYDVDRQLGVARGARTEFSQGANWFIQGDLYTSGTDRIYGHDAAFTSCDLEVPHWHFNAGEVKVISERVLVARNVTLNFADVPVFWLPFMMQSMERGRRSGLLTPRFSINDIARTSSNYRRRLSDVGFYWAINDYLGARMSLDWYSGSWTALQGDLQYRWLDQFLNGNMAFSHYWREGGRRDLTLRGGTSWQFDERTNLNADVNYASSSEFVRQNTFDPRELRRNNIGSSANLNRRFDWGSMNLGARRQQYLSDDRVEFTLPSLSVNLSPLTLFEAPSSSASWYNNATWTANGSLNMRGADVSETSPGQSQRTMTSSLSSSFSLGSLSWGQSFSLDERVDLARDAFEPDTALPRTERRQMSWTTSVGYQQRLIGTSSITPSLSWSGGMESSPESGGQLVARPSRLDFGTSLSTDVYGFWPGAGPFSRIRHRLSPSLSYRYSPAVTATPRQRELFNVDQLREQNALTISLNQTIEAKYEETDTAAAPADTAAADASGEPRRRPQARKSTLLSLTTSALAYDWAAADGPAFTTDQISHTLSSDLLRGLQLSFTHDLFDGTGTRRDFAPSLTHLSTSFSLNSRSGIFRLLGLAGDEAEPAPEADAAAADSVAVSDQNTGLGLIDRARGARTSEYGAGADAIGEWSANLRYTFFRPRTESLTGGLQPEANQMLQGTVSFRPTENWNVHWNTAYSLTNNEFSDHILTLTRDLHRWQANFDFVKAQNGNFTFQFRVALLDNPDLKLDYEQRGRSPVRGF